MKTLKALSLIFLAVAFVACAQKGKPDEQQNTQTTEQNQVADTVAQTAPVEPEQVKPVQQTDNNKYRLVMGAFVVKANAERTFERLAAAGYHPEYITMGRFTAVGVGSYPSYSTAYKDLQHILRQDVKAPAETWIYKKK